MRVGIDSGGTFVDVVALDDAGQLRVHKRPASREAPWQPVLDGARVVAGQATVAELVHATTVATNALLERRGGPALLVTTAGFEDVLELARQTRPQLYALHPQLPAPLVDAPLRLGLDERLAADGSVLRAPSVEALAELRARVEAALRDQGVRAIAVCLLHAHVNDAHERKVAEVLAPLGVPLSLSSDVLPLMREYERTSTTVVDAYVKPAVAPYLSRLGEAAARVRVMQSSGGASSAAEAAARPVRTLLSGPAAGVIGAQAVARAVGLGDVVTFDMGGTSTDVALIAGGEVALTDEAEVAGCVLQLPMLAIHTVGAGGGSLLWRDGGGALKVGPESAGAEPGPAAYDRGGERATITDANLVLGRLPAGLLGGAMPLSLERARAALAPLAAELGLTVERAAEDALAVAAALMARAIKVISVERGHDPADCTLLPFGGAGALHAGAVARELGMTRIVVPPSPGLLCAYGALAADVLHERVATRARLLAPGARLSPAELAADFLPLTAAVMRALDDDGVAPAARRLQRLATLRYRGQSFELPVGLGRDVDDVVAAFHAAHAARYGYALPERAVELVTLRLRGRGLTELPPPPREPADEGPPELGRAALWLDGRVHDAPLLARRRLRAGVSVRGPALIAEYSATTLLPLDARADVLPSGALAISLDR